MKKSPLQLEILAALNDVHRQKIVGRAEIRAKIEAQFEAQMYDLKLQEASLMIQGQDAGLPKSVLGRAIGTTDWATIQHMLDLGRTMRPEVEVIQEKFTGTVVARLYHTDVYVALVIAGLEHEFTLANGVTYNGWKVVLNTIEKTAQIMVLASEIEPDSAAARFVIENWKTFPDESGM